MNIIDLKKKNFPVFFLINIFVKYIIDENCSIRSLHTYTYIKSIYFGVFNPELYKYFTHRRYN